MDPTVILGSDTLPVAPGQEARLAVRIRNSGRRVESYRVDVVGPAAAFSRVEPASVSVLPGREEPVQIIFQPPPGATTPTGAVPFGVRVSSVVDADSSAVAEGRLEVHGVAGLQGWAPDTTRSGRWSANYRVQFANQGNTPVRLAVLAHDPAGVLNLQVADDVVDLQPGAQAVAKVKARARKPFLRGSAVNHTFQVSSQTFAFGAQRPAAGSVPAPNDPGSRTFPLIFRQLPILSKGVIAALALVIGLVVILVVLRWRESDTYALRTIAPEAPSSLTANGRSSSEIALTWSEVPNALGYAVRETDENGRKVGEVVETLDPGVLDHVVTSLAPQTRRCFTVVALGPEGAGDSADAQFQCATTPAPATLDAPESLTHAIQGDNIVLQWVYPETPGVTFAVFVNNEQAGTPERSPATLALEPQAEPYEKQIYVKAVGADGAQSDPSNIVVVQVPALTADTTSGTPTPTLVPVPSTSPSGGGGAPTTTAGAPTAADELTDTDPGSVSILGPIPPLTQFGVDPEVRRAQLAAAAGVPVEQVLTFSTRDVHIEWVAGQLPTGGSVAPFTAAYVKHADAATASAFCASKPSCFAANAARASTRWQNQYILVLGAAPSDATTADVDRDLTELRTGSGDIDVYVLSSADFPATFSDADGLIYFGGVFATEAEAARACAQIGPQCRPLVLVP